MLVKAREQGGEIKIKFTLKPKLTVNQLRSSFDECNSLTPPSLTKSNKESSDLFAPDDDCTHRHQIRITICKCFNNVKHKGKTVHHDHNANFIKFCMMTGTKNRCGTRSPPQHLQLKESQERTNQSDPDQTCANGAQF